MSDALIVWDLRVEHIASGRVYANVLFYNLEDAKKHAEEYVEGQVSWSYPENEVSPYGYAVVPYNYAVGHNHPEPHLTFVVRRRQIR